MWFAWFAWFAWIAFYPHPFRDVSFEKKKWIYFALFLDFRALWSATLIVAPMQDMCKNFEAFPSFNLPISSSYENWSANAAISKLIGCI